MSPFDMFNSVFDDLFGMGRGRSGGRPRPQKGATLKVRMDLTFEEAFRGIEREVSVSHFSDCGECKGSGAAPGGVSVCQDCGGSGQRVTQTGFMTVAMPCQRCGGQGHVITKACKACGGDGKVQHERKLKITVPAGVDSGDAMPLRGEGEQGVNGGPPGDLVVVFRVSDHPDYQREGSTLRRLVSIDFITAALGGTVPISLLDGEAEVQIEAGTQPGTVVTLPKRGMPNPQNGRRGPLEVHLQVRIPTKLSREQRKALEGLRPVFEAS